jgi:hypothetical protein
MPKQKGPTLANVTQAILAELTQPISLDEFIERVLERYPSQAKDPRQRVREYLRWDGARDGILLLDAQTLAPTSVALQGVRFRVPLDADEIKQGVVIAEPGFIPFIKSSGRDGWMAIKGEFFDVHNLPIPSRVISLPVSMTSFLDGKPVEINLPAFEMREWLSHHHAQAGDSILATALDLTQGHFRLEFEPRAQRRESDIAKQNRAFADLVWTMLQETVDEQLITPFAIPTAFARLPTARDYPGDHWFQALNADQRMRVTDWSINTADHRIPLDMILDPFGDTDVEELPFTAEQGGRVYRFHATANYRRHERTIEILGDNTLAEFDDVMRTAFRLDHVDHLSEFTHITRRGKGKRPHRHAYGEINPFEGSAAMDLHVAGLGLESGAELEYVYDFGDWLEHKLILEQIGEPEPGAEYPRVVGEEKKIAPKRKPASRARQVTLANQPRCGLCGSTTKPLTRTPCCGNWICDDEDDYVLFSYATNSCHRNHDRYTLCSYHYNERHTGRWQDCDKCRKGFETEIYVWYGTNEYNFEKLANPPKFEPTHCGDCGHVIHLGTDGYLLSEGKYYCGRCGNKRMRKTIAAEQTGKKKPSSSSRSRK